MPNFAQDIEAVANGESIVAIVIGPFGWSYELDDDNAYGEDRIARKAKAKRGVVLSWEEARPMLDYEYSRGFGSPECEAIWAWTNTMVLFVSQYDGATAIYSIPRNPHDGKPEMPGG